MANSRQLASGRHLTAFHLILQTINSDGSLAGGTDFKLTEKSSFTGYLEDVEFDVEQNVDDGTVLGSPIDNDIPTTYRHSLTLTEPLRYNSGANVGNQLAEAITNAATNGDGTVGTPFCKLTLARGGKTWTFYSVMRTYRESYRKNKFVGVMTLSVTDVGTANPTYA